MTSCWSILIGARRVGSRRTFSRADNRRLQTITAHHFPGGYTVLEASGGWYDSSIRKFVREDSRQVLVTSSSVRAVEMWARDLGTALRQKEMLLVKLGGIRRIRVPSRRK